MDKEIKTLLVEVAKTVLRVLDAPARVEQPERPSKPQASLPLSDAAPPIARGTLCGSGPATSTPWARLTASAVARPRRSRCA